MSDWEDFKIIAIAFTVIALIVGGLIAILVTSERGKEELCRSRYGSEWWYVSGDRSPDFCTNENGDVRYPRDWYEK